MIELDCDARNGATGHHLHRDTMNDLTDERERDPRVVCVREHDLDVDRLPNLEGFFGRDKNSAIRDVLFELLAERIRRLESDLKGLFSHNSDHLRTSAQARPPAEAHPRR